MELANNKDFRWYAVYCVSNQENKIVNLIKTRIENAGLSEFLEEIIIPTQEKVLLRKGQKKTVNERFLPGYILIKMVLNDNTWPMVRDTQGVINFVGTDKKPSPLTEKEVSAIVEFSNTKVPTYKINYSEGDTVVVKDGEFKDFTGTIDSIDTAKGKIKVNLQFLGREVPVELDVNLLEKM